MTLLVPRTRLLARLLAASAVAVTACGGSGESHGTDSIFTQTPEGKGGHAGSSGSSGHGGGEAVAGAGGSSDVGGAGGVGGSSDVGGAGGVGGSSDVVDVGGAGGAVSAGGAGGAAGAGGGETLPACVLTASCTGMICYERGADAACEPLDSPLASVKLGCQLGPSFDTAYPMGEQCCYGQFCGGGRPLRVGGLPTHSLALRRADWS